LVPGPTLLDLVALANDDVAAVGARHRAADQQQVVLGIDANHQQVPHRDAVDAHVTGHAMTLEDVVRIGIHADRPDVTVHLLHAVTGALPGEVVPLHHAGGPAALGRADDVDRLDVGEDVDLQLLADLKTVAGDAELANETLRLAIRFRDGLNAGCRPALLTLAIQTCDVAAEAAAG
jgi:hypothetical protein